MSQQRKVRSRISATRRDLLFRGLLGYVTSVARILVKASLTLVFSLYTGTDFTTYVPDLLLPQINTWTLLCGLGHES